MTEYQLAQKKDREEILDLINYVFSYSARPHEFRTLLPKVYADELDVLGAEHYVAREDGRIRGVVAVRYFDMILSGNRLKIGYVGSVSVHPRSRGKGYMSRLMECALADAKRRGVHLLALSGMRQRYGVFGFENAGILYRFSVTKSNIRRAFSDVDTSCLSFRPLSDAEPEDVRLARALYERKNVHTVRPDDAFLRILRSWNETPLSILKSGRPIGYAYGPFNELLLNDESDFPAVLKALFPSADSVTVPVGSHDRERISFLSSICESYSIGFCEKVNVLDWPAVVSALLGLKAGLTELSDGEATFEIDGQCFRISVQNDRVTVVSSRPGPDSVALSHAEAERTMFDLDELLTGKRAYGNWFPLPFSIDRADAF